MTLDVLASWTELSVYFYTCARFVYWIQLFLKVLLSNKRALRNTLKVVLKKHKSIAK